MESNKYHSSKIYKIIDNSYSKTYYGSTTQSLSKRMAEHRSKYLKQTKYCTAFIIFEEFGIDNCKIELVEQIKCDNKEELRKIEGEYIKNNECVNKAVAGRTKKEYMDYYKTSGRLQEVNQNYRKKHKAYLEAFHANYYQKHSKDIINRTKEYYEQHCSAINEARNEICSCECGLTYSRRNKARHEKTAKHTELMQSKSKTIEL